jgi:5-methylcytosine-specific restriction protein B
MSTDREILDAFLTAWPIDRLSAMSLEDYSSVGSEDTLTRWLESRTEQLGSTWGGSSFKFGVYRRKSTEKKFTLDRYGDDGKYAWERKYGDSAKRFVLGW